jgi:hypothetical protein
MDSQVQSAQQISEAMNQINEVSMQNNNSFQEINTAISQLNVAAQGLQEEMGRFKVNDSGTDTFPPSSSPKAETSSTNTSSWQNLEQTSPLAQM